MHGRHRRRLPSAHHSSAPAARNRFAIGRQWCRSSRRTRTVAAISGVVPRSLPRSTSAPASINSWATSRSFSETASSKGVDPRIGRPFVRRPAYLCRLMSAPASINICTTSRSPPSTALCNAVLPLSSWLVSTSAPASSKIRTIAASPCRAATINAVEPSLLLLALATTLTSTPASRSIRTTLTEPSRTAANNRRRASRSSSTAPPAKSKASISGCAPSSAPSTPSDGSAPAPSIASTASIFPLLAAADSPPERTVGDKTSVWSASSILMISSRPFSAATDRAREEKDAPPLSKSGTISTWPASAAASRAVWLSVQPVTTPSRSIPARMRSSTALLSLFVADCTKPPGVNGTPRRPSSSRASSGLSSHPLIRVNTMNTAMLNRRTLHLQCGVSFSASLPLSSPLLRAARGPHCRIARYAVTHQRRPSRSSPTTRRSRPSAQTGRPQLLQSAA